MKWSDFSETQKELILQNASNRAAMGEELEFDSSPISKGVTNVDIAKYAMGNTQGLSIASLKFALRTDLALRQRFDDLMDHYATLQVPLARAAATEAFAGRRRDPKTGLEVEWIASSVEPSTIIVKILIPESLKVNSVARLVLRNDDEIAEIHLPDDDLDDTIEVLIDRSSDEFHLLSDGESKLWLS
ncbi:MAG: hypothetical protein AAF996_04735 [Pseudomonadota bacterium]